MGSQEKKSPAREEFLWVIKDEPFTRVEVVHSGGGTLVRKLYRNRPKFWWRTLLLPSRARREYRNLSILRERGVPCVEVVSWSEERGAFSQVRSSSLTTRFLEGCRSLKAFFRQEDPSEPGKGRARRAYQEALGRILRRLHTAGVLHGAASTRNFLALGYPEDPRVVICDVPYLAAFPRSILGRRAGNLDLYDSIFAPGRKRELSRGEKFRILWAYTEGDRLLARKIWKKLSRRPRWRNKAEKALLVAWDSYVRMFFRLLAGKVQGPRKSAHGGGEVKRNEPETT